MDRTFFERNLNNLTVQRNFLLGLTSLLAVGIILTSTFLFFKTEKIIIVPAVIEKEFWVDSNTISATYLEQFGLFLGQLLLNKSSYSAPINRAILCRHTEPHYLNLLKQKLFEEEETLKKQNASYVFFLTNIFTNPEQLTVTLLGERQFLIGSQKPSHEKCIYTLNFTYTGARLLLSGITQEKEQSLLGVN